MTLRKRVIYTIDPETGMLGEREVGVVGGAIGEGVKAGDGGMAFTARIEFDMSEYCRVLEKLIDAAAANGFDVEEWAEGWGRFKRGVWELVEAANGKPRLNVVPDREESE